VNKSAVLSVTEIELVIMYQLTFGGYSNSCKKRELQKNTTVATQALDGYRI